MDATQHLGQGVWGRGSEAGGPKEGADLAGWGNDRKPSMAEESEQGDVKGAGL